MAYTFQGVEKKACCNPTLGRPHAQPVSQVHETRTEPNPAVIESMISLKGGAFLMGTDYAEAFPDDGESPIRSVTVDPFKIDRYPVTNALFARFVNESGYLTEAEKFGWSFVFWAHIPASRRKELVNDTVAAAPWWCQVFGASWKAPEGPGTSVNE